MDFMCQITTRYAESWTPENKKKFTNDYYIQSTNAIARRYNSTKCKAYTLHTDHWQWLNNMPNEHPFHSLLLILRPKGARTS